MLRESSVPYSSLPQEEGEQTYITTRTSGETHTHDKGRLLSIILVLLLICGVPLMIIAPLALSKGSGRSATSVSQAVDSTLPHSESHNENNDTSKKDNQSIVINAATPPSQVGVPIPEIKSTPPKIPNTVPPVTTTKPTTTTTTSTTTTPTTTTTTTTTTTAAPIIRPVVIVVPTASVHNSSVEVPVGEAGKNQSGGSAGTTEVSQKGEEGSDGGSVSGNPDGEDNDGFSYTSTQNISSLMNNFITKHEWWTLVALAVAAALALATVIATVTWIIHNRLASRRRRTNLQKVITDLQSRDKVVLLNSEDSEEEA